MQHIYSALGSVLLVLLLSGRVLAAPLYFTVTQPDGAYPPPPGPILTKSHPMPNTGTIENIGVSYQDVHPANTFTLSMQGLYSSPQLDALYRCFATSCEGSFPYPTTFDVAFHFDDWLGADGTVVCSSPPVIYPGSSSFYVNFDVLLCGTVKASHTLSGEIYGIQPLMFSNVSVTPVGGSLQLSFDLLKPQAQCNPPDFYQPLLTLDLTGCSAPIPEPQSLLLLAAGALLYRRRRGS